MNDDSKWLQMIDENGNPFYEKDSDYNNILAYKNRCQEYYEKIKIAIRSVIPTEEMYEYRYEKGEMPIKQLCRLSAEAARNNIRVERNDIS